MRIKIFEQKLLETFDNSSEIDELIDGDDDFQVSISKPEPTDDFAKRVEDFLNENTGFEIKTIKKKGSYDLLVFILIEQ